MNDHMKLAKRRKFTFSMLWPYVLCLPFVIAYLVFSIFPTLYSLYISFFDWNGISEKVFVGIQNYMDILTKDVLFYKSVYNTVMMMVFSIPFQIIIGLLLAQFVFNLGRSRRVYETIVFLPYIISPVICGIIFIYLFDWHTGYVNDIFYRLGLNSQINWLRSPGLSKVIIAIMNIWRQTGYCMVIYLAAMTSISQDIIEASKIDGANSIQTFLYVTVPQLNNISVFLILTSIINGLQMFEMPKLLYGGTGMQQGTIGGPQQSALTIIWKFYDNTFGSGMHIGYGAAISYILFIIIILFTLVPNMFRRKVN